MSAAPLAAHIMHVRDLEGIHMKMKEGDMLGGSFYWCADQVLKQPTLLGSGI